MQVESVGLLACRLSLLALLLSACQARSAKTRDESNGGSSLKNMPAATANMIPGDSQTNRASDAVTLVDGSKASTANGEFHRFSPTVRVDLLRMDQCESCTLAVCGSHQNSSHNSSKSLCDFIYWRRAINCDVRARYRRRTRLESVSHRASKRVDATEIKFN